MSDQEEVQNLLRLKTIIDETRGKLLQATAELTELSQMLQEAMDASSQVPAGDEAAPGAEEMPNLDFGHGQEPVNVPEEIPEQAESVGHRGSA